MKTFTSKIKLIPMLMVMFLVGVTSCKKNNTPEPTPETPVAKLSGKIDGKDLNISAANLSSTYYTTAGEAASSLAASAALDASGNKLNFFIDDVKNGTITISPKLGTSSNPGNPNTRVNATGTAAAPVQTYVSYVNSGNTYYAISGSVTVVIDSSKGITISWSITFKDASGRSFTSEGNFFLPIYTSNPKPKTEVVDPTPVSAKPTIDNISPTSGAAGDTVLIAGTNFSTTLTENVVKFGSETATVKAATATKLTVIAPTSQTSTISVKVKNSETTTGPTFTYVLPPTFSAMAPQNGKVGDVLTFTGANFSTTLTDNVVSFNGVAATVTAATATTLTVTVPANVTTGIVTVKVRGKNATLVNGFTGIFTVTITTPPTTSVGTAGQAYLLNGSYSAFTKAVDNEGNIYVVDENFQLYKMNPSGEILKSFTKNDITFKSMNSYKCVAITSNKKGAIRAILNCATFPNGQAEVYIVNIGTGGSIGKETQTTLFDTDLTGMVWDNTNYYVLTNHYSTDDIVKINGTDGTFAQYLKGGASGDFDGSSPYSMDLDGDNNLFVLSYLKGQFSNSIPTKQAIYKFDPSKVKSTILASYTDGYLDGAIGTAQFKDLRSLVVSNQDLFVGDNGNFRVRKIAPRTGLVTTIAGNGKATEPTNGNQPIYAGGLLNVNLRGSNGLLLSASYGALYNFSSGQTGFQKFVLSQ